MMTAIFPSEITLSSTFKTRDQAKEVPMQNEGVAIRDRTKIILTNSNYRGLA